MKKMSGTDSILNSFDGVSLEDWMTKIHEDLRGKTIEEMDWEFDDELTIKPFVQSDDIEAGYSSIAYDATWEIAEEFNIVDEVSSNSEILEALTGGCEVVLLKVKNIPNWSLLFNEIDLGLIKTYIIPDSEEKTQVLIASLDDFIGSYPGGTNARTGSTEPLIHVRNDKNAIGGPSAVHLDKTVAKGLANTIQEGIQLITQAYDHDTVECVVEIGDAYFVEIARLRALRILWSNVLDALNKDKPALFIEGRFSSRDMTDDVHYNMISAGSKAMSAISGGVDRLIIAPAHLEPTAFHRRISRNIHHILRYESKLDTISDPVKGSYYIEYLTKQLVESAWSKLIDSLKRVTTM